MKIPLPKNKFYFLCNLVNGLRHGQFLIMNTIDPERQVLWKNSYPRRRRHVPKAILAGVRIFALLALVMLPRVPESGVIVQERYASLTPVRIPESLTPGDQSRSEIVPAKGRFLVATRQLDKSVFAETVILLLDYGVHGAAGLIINMPTEIKLSTLLPKVSELEHRKDRVYIGGPVGSTSVSLLVKSGSKPEDSISVFDDIYVSSSMKTLKGLAGSKEGKVKFRVYLGYAGWGPGQLDREILMGAWHVFEGNAEIVIDEKPSRIWPKFNHRKSQQPERIDL